MSTASPRASSPAEEAASQPPLFADKVKVYPKRVKGPFRRFKWALLVVLLGIYYLTPWLRWDRGAGIPDQAVLFDLNGRRLYFFFIELWPQQIYYLTGILVFSAIALFLTTTLFGRLWCAYACPQTVWTDLFLWVERLTEGDRGDRIRLDRGPWTKEKFWRKTAKHSAWLLISAATGGAWIFYFSDAPTLVREMVNLEASWRTMAFIGLFTATTYVLAGFAREHVCIYMCPWPRFQAAMQDEDSLIVTYRDWRGEQRGPLRKSVSWEQRQAKGLGDCIDCGACVHVCPTGTDIRKGSQLSCIGCALCIDACDEVMTKIGRPRGLVAFDTENNRQAKAAGEPARYRLFRLRTVLYTLVLVGLSTIMVAHYLNRPVVHLSVLRDRAPIYTVLAHGEVRNGYTLHISNMTLEPRRYTLAVHGIDGARLSLAGSDQTDQERLALGSGPDAVTTWRVLVKAQRSHLTGLSTPLEFELVSEADHETERYESVFLGPDK
jgi:cytochrome c oxidase accessory protein FixG